MASNFNSAMSAIIDDKVVAGATKGSNTIKEDPIVALTVRKKKKKK